MYRYELFDNEKVIDDLEEFVRIEDAYNHIYKDILRIHNKNPFINVFGEKKFQDLKTKMYIIFLPTYACRDYREMIELIGNSIKTSRLEDVRSLSGGLEFYIGSNFIIDLQPGYDFKNFMVWSGYIDVKERLGGFSMIVSSDEIATNSDSWQCGVVNYCRIYPIRNSDYDIRYSGKEIIITLSDEMDTEAGYIKFDLKEEKILNLLNNDLEVRVMVSGIEQDTILYGSRGLKYISDVSECGRSAFYDWCSVNDFDFDSFYSREVHND